MKKIIIIPFLFILVSIVSCSKGSNSDAITIPDYKKWKKPVDKILDYPVPGHGPGFRIIYANDITFTATESTDSRGRKKIVFPEGSYIVKESYKSKKDIGKKEPVVFAMIKNSKSTQSVSGWIYYLKKPGESPAVIKTKMCNGCHEAANEKHPYFDGNPDDSFRDYIFVPYVNRK
jgi:hypothetical protein